MGFFIGLKVRSPEGVLKTKTRQGQDKALLSSQSNATVVTVCNQILFVNALNLHIECTAPSSRKLSLLVLKAWHQLALQASP